MEGKGPADQRPGLRFLPVRVWFGSPDPVARCGIAPLRLDGKPARETGLQGYSVLKGTA